MSSWVCVPIDSHLCRIRSIDVTSEWQHKNRSVRRIQTVMPTGRRDTITPDGALYILYLCVCCSFIFEECMLFITINEACNPQTIVFSLYLSKHNS